MTITLPSSMWTLTCWQCTSEASPTEHIVGGLETQQSSRNYTKETTHPRSFSLSNAGDTQLLADKHASSPPLSTHNRHPLHPPPPPSNMSIVETFDILVGPPSNQKIFTVQRNLLARRSEFFATIRSARWTNSSPKPVDPSSTSPNQKAQPNATTA